MITLLLLNLTAIVGLGLDLIGATGSLRVQWVLIGSCGFGCLVALRAWKLSSEMSHRLSRLSRIDRLIQD